MKESGLLLGVDVGTSSCKVDIFRADGTQVAGGSAAYPVYCPAPGISEQDPEDWWQGVCSAIREALESGEVESGRIAALGLGGQGWSAIALDGAGQVLCRTPIWNDMRAQKQCDWAESVVGEDRLFRCGGNPTMPSYTLPKILWYRDEQPDVYEKADKILQSNSFIAWKLTGTVAQDLCQSYAYQCFDMEKGCWDEEIIRELEIRRSLLPELVKCHQVVGGVTAEAAARTGLLQGTPVVAGGLDAACGSLGAGVCRPGQTQEQGGQAGGMSICTREMIADKRLILSRHVVDGLFLLQGGSVGGSGAFKWLSEQLCEGETLRFPDDPFVEMSRMAGEIKAGSEGVLFLPYMSGERSPIWDPHARGVFYGLDFSKTRAHLIRACMEGVAYSLRHNCQVALEAGAKIERFFSMGGAANSLVWTQIKADVTGTPIDVPNTSSATTLGAAIVAGVGTGLYEGFEGAVDQCVRFTRSHEPDPANKGVYDEGFERYLELYQRLRPMMQG